MIKGKSTVQLFDAKTGKQISSQTNSNMVTNAIDIIANNKDDLELLRWEKLLLSGVASYNNSTKDLISVTPLPAMMPIAQKAMSGVLLWDENITEDPSIVIKPDKIHELGHAGSPYSGADIYRGSYNENESGPIEGGYRHVWDFDTDKANGTIKCISLTSQNGGNVGYHFLNDSGTHPLYNQKFFHSSNYFIPPAHDNDYVEYTGDKIGRSFYIKRLGADGIRAYERSGTSVFYYDVHNLSNKISIMQERTPVMEKPVDLPIKLIEKNDTLYVYDGKINEIHVSGSTLRHLTFDLDGKSISDKTINLPFSMLYKCSPAVYRDGYYYCIGAEKDNSNIKKIDAQGNLIASLSPNTTKNAIVGSGVIINSFSGEIMYSFINNNNATSLYVMVIDSEDNVRWVTTGSLVNPYSGTVNYDFQAQLIQFDNMKTPFLFASDGYYAFRIIPLINTGYLATINNLQTPIVKTPAHTMKITYEIYDE